MVKAFTFIFISICDVRNCQKRKKTITLIFLKLKKTRKLQSFRDTIQKNYLIRYNHMKKNAVRIFISKIKNQFLKNGLV